MDIYSNALKAWLETPERTQLALADAVGTTQASIHRYATGQRLPEADVARKIDEATGGAVSFAIWQQAAMAKMGIPSDDEKSEAA